jgi:uncharacterized protein (DUF2267 family)
MKERELSEIVKDRAGLRSIAEGKRALRATLGALRCALDEADARAAAKELGPDLGPLLERPPTAIVRSAPDLYREADRRERVGLGFATEHVQVVLQVLAERLDPELVTRLRKRLSSEIAELLRERSIADDAPPHVRMHPAHAPEPMQTLSRARPGSGESIAETRHEPAHAASVARSESPHSDTMVETARSARPGREDDTLASTRGGDGRRR